MGQSLRILLVEDSEDDAELMLRELKRSGYDVACERVVSAQRAYRRVYARQLGYR